VRKDGRVQWTRAVYHLRNLAEQCADLASRQGSIFRLRVVQLWAVGDILGPPRELDWIRVALAVDLPVEEVPWLSEPVGAEHWANATRMAKNPIGPLWRSVHAPIWNHLIDRPALVWDAATGPAEDTIAAIADGRGAQVREPAPTADELRKRLDDELAVGLDALRQHTRVYEDRRWAPGKVTPFADALWRASNGYLDLLDAIG
jgi:hypothetical protein